MKFKIRSNLLNTMEKNPRHFGSPINVEWGKKKASFYFYEIGSILQKRQIARYLKCQLI